MPGHSCPRTASLPLAYAPGIHVLLSPDKKGVDGRVTFAKTRFALLPGQDEECAPFSTALQRAPHLE